MARPHTDSDTPIPEADLLDQHTPAVPESVDATEDPAGALDANEADVVEQASGLPGGEDEEDYPTTSQDRSWEVWPDA